MEPQDGEVTDKESKELTVDSSKQNLRKIERADGKRQLTETLLLDYNEIQKLDNLETYTNLKKLSISNNQLIRMYGVSSLVNLTSINISHNSLVIIEGLKHLKELRELNLARNRLKTIEQLKHNLKLEKLDLSGNTIGALSDLSFLQHLKELRMHSNKIVHLTSCERYLPCHLEVLTFNDNLISDLNEVSYLGHLTSLRDLCIANNPCVKFSEGQEFNYRPFIKNWIGSLVALDNCPLDDIECLKGEWLYSHGRGRSFRPGEHAALVEYLISVCPKEGKESAETEDVKKLKLILSKAQLHQQQLREQLTTAEGSRNSLVKKKASVTLEKMFTSVQDSPARDARATPELMTRSLDSGMTRKFTKFSKSDLTHTPLQTSTTFLPIPDTLISPDLVQTGSCPAPNSSSSRTSRSSSRNSAHSTPEPKRKASMYLLQRRGDLSPLALKKSGKLINCRSSTPLEVSGNPRRHTPSRNVSTPVKKGSRSRNSGSRESQKSHRETSEDEDEDEENNEMLTLKLKAIQERVNQLKQDRTLNVEKPRGRQERECLKVKKGRSVSPNLNETKVWKAAVCIQRRWRGYRARNLNREVLAGCKDIQINRIQDYIMKVMFDMEATRVALEGNRKLVILQMQAINSLWKKIATLQPNIGSSPGENQACIQNLMDTCSTLNKQIEGLQAMVKNMQAPSNPSCLIPTGTQTEIVAVHTPHGDNTETFRYVPLEKSSQNSITCHSVGNEEKLSEGGADESNNGSGAKTLAELFNSFSMEETRSLQDHLDRSGSGEVVVFGEQLTKPSVKLSETDTRDSEVPKETLEKMNEEISEDPEFGNTFNS